MIIIINNISVFFSVQVLAQDLPPGSQSKLPQGSRFHIVNSMYIACLLHVY